MKNDERMHVIDWIKSTKMITEIKKYDYFKWIFLDTSTEYISNFLIQQGAQLVTSGSDIL